MTMVTVSNTLSSDCLPDADDARSEHGLSTYSFGSSILESKETKGFEYKLAKNLTGPEMSLTVYGDSRLSSELPSFMEGDKIAGEVRVASANNGQYIQAVEVSLKGRVVTGRTSDGAYTFLSLRKTLWTAELGKLDTYRESLTNDSEGCLWHFSFDLPREIILANGDDNEKNQVFPLPRTFTEAGIPARVYYELAVCMRQSRWKRNRRIITEIGCFQSSLSILSTPAAKLYAIAADDCWKSLRTVNVIGILPQLQQRKAELRCTLHVKNSLYYSPGSSIPLLLEIWSKDQQALELSASPDAIVVQLNRRISYKDLQMCGSSSSCWSKVTETVGLATAWSLREPAPSEEPVLSESCRSTLVGKIELKQELVPSAAIANLSIEYFVSMYTFSSPAFHPTDNKSAALVSQTVQINSDISARPPRTRVTSPEPISLHLIC